MKGAFACDRIQLLSSVSIRHVRENERKQRKLEGFFELYLSAYCATR